MHLSSKNVKNCKVYIETYGCSANQSESEMIAGILEGNEIKIVDSSELADIIVVNTCIVKKSTETKILYRIKQLELSKKGLVIAGCMPEIRQREILRIAPNSCIISTHQIKKIVSAIDSLVKGDKAYFIGKNNEENINAPRKRSNPVIAIIEISKGCLGECTYCSVKGVKGDLHSYSQKSIIQEIQNAVSEGCKEIWLTSQDCGCYGKEKNETIIDLLKNIEKIQGNFRIRIGMMNPEHIPPILDELIQCYKNERVYKFIHIPVQSGSDSVLGRMSRRYTIEDFKKIITKFRKEIPEINIWTDLIIGFPEESNKEFESTIKLIKEIKPNFVNISKFGAMKGTFAAEMKQVDSKIINERAKIISELCKNVSTEVNKAQIGKTKRLLITEKGKHDTLKGRDESFRQVVLRSPNAKIGDFIESQIISASHFGLFTS